MKKIFSLINQLPIHKESIENICSFENELSFSYFLANEFQNNPQNYVVLAPNLYNAQNIYEKLSLLLGEENCYLFPVDEVFLSNNYTSSKEFLSQRLYVLNASLDKKKKIIITHPSSFNRYLPDPKLYSDNTLYLKKNHQYSIEDIINSLISLSFTRVNKIDQRLQFALRGDILDIFPINEDSPIRIEFFDDEIESIRYFAIDTQLSIKEIEEAKIFPSSDLLLDKNDFHVGKNRIFDDFNKIKIELSLAETDKLKKIIDNDLEYLANNSFLEKYYQYYHFFFEKGYSLKDYLDDPVLFIYQYDQVLHANNIKQQEFVNYNLDLFKNGLSLKTTSYNLPLEDLIDKYPRVIKSYSYYQEGMERLSLTNIPFHIENPQGSLSLIKLYLDKGFVIEIYLNEKYYEFYKTFLFDNNIDFSLNECDDSQIYLFLDDLKEGFIYEDQKLLVLSKKEIFSYHQDLSLFSARFKKSQILSSFSDLKEGDYIVHEQYGIGIYQGIATIPDVNENPSDYLKILYANNSVLYVPLMRFSVIRKYIGSEGSKPRLSHLGRDDWSNVKEKIKQQVNYLAERLIELYAKRETIEGNSLLGDEELEQEFAAAFPYELTKDQESALKDIFYDMASPHPMDRLISGDVGFGKTEVAFRAAFKAILSNKQVALLCPTTILAKQHYDVASSRFALFGVKIALFSRFVPLKQQNENIKKILNGEINLIIGTHRILSEDIKIPNLGLLIIDEEQRFGVEHKEKIKELTTNIDVLTLTATPIPRTLEMSLIGIRNLSQLNTPPRARMPIQTYVVPYEKTLLKEVVSRELGRSGQVYYLFNNVKKIYEKSREIQKMVPSARIGIVHAKMDKNDIDLTMNSFYNHDIDILICTTIVESGLDVPNANTIIIENADCFGLSQLYQIKGRVGRSNKVAYAYLFYNENKDMTLEANERLKAIKEFTELGSGIKIAQEDLAIRGAGDLLGPKQSGFINSVGLDLYVDILNEVIKEKKGREKEKKKIINSNISVGGYIPSSYALDNDKLELYQEIVACESIKDIELFRRKVRDIYGQLPKNVDLLILKRKIDILGSSENIESLSESDMITIVLSKKCLQIRGIAYTLDQKLSKYRDIMYLKISNDNILLRIKKDKKNIDALVAILEFINTLKE